MWFKRVVLLLGVVVVFGCGGGPAPQGSESDIIVNNIKGILEAVAVTGERTEAIAECRDHAESLKPLDGAKADIIINGLKEMEVMTSRSQVQAKAKELASKL